MIEVKALRPTQPSSASAEETYRKTQDEPAASRWPAALTVIVLAVAAYLRSLVGAEANPQDEPQPQDEPDATRPQLAEDNAENDVDETGALPDKKAEPDPDGVLGSGAASGPIPGLADFLGIDSPPIDYEQLPLPAFVRAAFEFGLGRVSNDNSFALAAQVGGSSVGPGRSEVGLAGSESLSRSDVSGFQLTSPIVVAPFKPVVIVPPPREEEPGEPVEPEDPRLRNRAPRLASAVQLGEIGPCQTLMLTLAGLLVGATDADGDTLGIRNLQVSSGTITLAEGGWQYKSLAGYFGPVTVSYTVTDGIAAVAQTASFNVVEVLVLVGTAGDDVLTGTDCKDLIRGGDGNDIIDARAGSDTVHGGTGHDIIFAGAGDDIVYGGAGNDVIHGGAGNDRLYGEDGDDRLFGEAGDDLLDGGNGNDELSGGDGNDTLHGGIGNDVISGGAGDDTAFGGDGSDLIDGGDGNDALYGGASNDTIFGGAGDDLISGGDGDDIIDAGDGNNEVDGGTGNNIITTGFGHNRIIAADGDNIVLGGAGTELVQLGFGRNVARLGGGNDIVAAGAGNDRLYGEDGDDTLAGEQGDDLLDGGAGDDTLLGGAGDDTLLGRDGDDIIAAGDGDDTVDGGEGDDVVDAGIGDDEVEGGDGDDVIHAGDGDDHVEGGQGNDVVEAGDGDDKVDGQDGDDVLDGGAGADCLIGADGDDTLLGRSGVDVLKGGAGDDTLDGGEGSDTVMAGAGDDVVIASLDAANDCVDGGSGHDTLDLSDTTCGVTVDLTEDKAVGIEIGEDTVLDFEALIGGDGDDRFIIGNTSMALTGGQGDDRFEFHVPEEAQNDLIHQILDLHEGDRIVIKQYEIHSDGAAGGTEIDPFSQTYTESGEAGRPFRFRIEKINDEERTYVDVFTTQQDDKDLSIEIYGSHKLYYYSY